MDVIKPGLLNAGSRFGLVSSIPGSVQQVHQFRPAGRVKLLLEYLPNDRLSKGTDGIHRPANLFPACTRVFVHLSIPRCRVDPLMVPARWESSFLIDR